MTSFVGEVVESRQDGVAVRFAPRACTGCGSPCGQTSLVSLPVAAGGRVKVSMAARNQWILLLNSLFLPLSGFILGASLGQWFLSNDVAAFLGAIAGLTGGALACRRQSFDRIDIEEVLN